MHYAEQPTPPFNSPYQTHVSRTDSLLEPPYLSPSKHSSIAKYPQGLGLYNYPQQIQTTLPPSPSPSDSWSSHVSNRSSPLMTQAIADPYASGAFEHPIIRSPQPWDGAQLSPRSSAPPATITTLYSHGSPGNTYHEVNQGLGVVTLEGQGWSHDSRYANVEPSLPSLRHHPLTVAPERLHGTMPGYEHVYNSTSTIALESAPSTEHSHQSYIPGSSESTAASRARFPHISAHPVRRHPIRKRQSSTPPVIYCDFPGCDKGFARNYNYKKHLETHVKNRPRPHVCHYADCFKGFVRKTDLDRHYKSVHDKIKDERCAKCSSVFARKDTCSRHESQGCSQRSQVQDYRARL